ILSEYPPGTPPLPHHFPLRNRLIAAFSDVLLVLEAREKSGSLITVDQALEQGKDVLALPGRVGDALSAGCLGLIRQGAGLLTCCGDVYETLGISPGDPKTPEGERTIPAGGLPKAHKRIWERLGTDPVHVEALMEQEEMSLGELSLILLELERRGCIRQTPGGGYMKL
ncbi:MAG: DNA-processing protein DprA, partial [Lachnospiraceae bacterium]|nr:DNA-processing protein DprA [Lachnospiraceae bacterium]